MTSLSRSEPVWLTAIQVRMLHAETLSLFGGPHGLRDQALLESALGRPRHLWTYRESVTHAELAASYAFGIARNHPFIDGNKRTALLVIRAFLFRNGHRFEPAEVEAVAMIEGLAAGSVSEEMLVEWIETNLKPL
jgi:death-on-curing protein